ARGHYHQYRARRAHRRGRVVPRTERGPHLGRRPGYLRSGTAGSEEPDLYAAERRIVSARGGPDVGELAETLWSQLCQHSTRRARRGPALGRTRTALTVSEMNMQLVFALVARKLCAACACLALIAPCHTVAAQPAFGAWGVDLSAMDKSVRPGDNFFQFVNGTWLKTAKIPADRSSTGS